MSVFHPKNPLIGFISSLLSYGIILALYLRVMFNLENEADFIYGPAIFMFIVEFLSIHSSGMLRSQVKRPIKLMLVSVYMLFVLIFSVSTGVFYPAAIFVFSLIAKVFMPVKADDRKLLSSVVLFMGVTFFVVFFAGLLSTIFPAPQQLLAQKPNDVSGIFLEQPTTVVIWGVLYFSSQMIYEAHQYFRSNQLSQVAAKRKSKQSRS